MNFLVSIDMVYQLALLKCFDYCKVFYTVLLQEACTGS